MLSARDIRDFRGFLRQATDRQVQGIYEKEKRGGRDDYAELAVAEAERRGIDLERSHHSTKKSRAQLDREIAEALSGRRHATIGGTRSWLAPGVIRPGDRVTIVDRFGAQRTGRAVMRGPHGWVLNLGGKHGTPGIATDENIVSVKSPGLKSGHAAKKQSSHATKRAVPGVSKWNTYAGGTGAAEGKHSYDLYVPEGQYTISPYTRSGGRHAGYLLKFAATGGRPRGTHGGLWHDLGSHRSPQAAASTAAKHYARGFE